MHYTENISQNQIKYYRILNVLRGERKNFGIWKRLAIPMTTGLMRQ